VSSALDGLRVVVLGVNVPALVAGQRLAALGAAVTKIEPPSGWSTGVPRTTVLPASAAGSPRAAGAGTDTRGSVNSTPSPNARRRLFARISRRFAYTRRTRATCRCNSPSSINVVMAASVARSPWMSSSERIAATLRSTAGGATM
jgi:hypothetical protein